MKKAVSPWFFWPRRKTSGTPAATVPWSSSPGIGMKKIIRGGRNFGHLAYAVTDIYALCERLMAAGVAINRPPRDGHMAFIRSPDGISIELLQDGQPCRPESRGPPWPTLEAGERNEFRVRQCLWRVARDLERASGGRSRRRACLWQRPHHQRPDRQVRRIIRTRSDGVSRSHRHRRQCAGACLPHAALWRGPVPQGQPHHDVGMRRAGILLRGQAGRTRGGGRKDHASDASPKVSPVWTEASTASNPRR